jgi:hypothetical protein
MKLRSRRISSGVLAVLLCPLLAVASLGLWAQQAVLNQSAFAQNTKEILAKPEVLAAISVYVVDETLQAVSRPSGTAGALLGDLLRGAIERQVSRVLASEIVQTEVVKAMVTTHRQFVALLESESDDVVFNLDPVFRAVMTGLVGEGVLRSDQLTSTGIGEVYLYRTDSSESVKNSLENARRAVSLVQQGLLLMLLLILVIGGAVFFLAPKMLNGVRNISLSLLMASTLCILIVKSGQFYSLNIIEDGLNRSAVSQILDVMTQDFVLLLIVCLVLSGLGVIATVRQGALLQTLSGNLRKK